MNVGGLPLAVIDRAQSAELMIESGDRATPKRLAAGLSSPPPMVRCSRCARAIRTYARCFCPPISFMPTARRSCSLRACAARRRCPSGWQRPTCSTTSRGWHRRRGATFFLLGAAPRRDADVDHQGTAAVSRAADRRLSPWLFRRGRNGRVIAEINAARPDILWIGMGVPREQFFALRHRGPSDQRRA